jgi:hypothetical protein
MRRAAGFPNGSNRRSGRTTRTLWRALLAASETDWADVVVVVPNVLLAGWTLEVLSELAGDTRWKLDKRDRRLYLQNGSSIQMLAKPTAPMKLFGRKATVFWDHPL